jgi:hypothetical protein
VNQKPRVGLWGWRILAKLNRLAALLDLGRYLGQFGIDIRFRSGARTVHHPHYFLDRRFT